MSGPKFNFRFAINCEENVEADATFDDFDEESEDSQEQSTASTSTSNDNGSTA